MEVKSRVKISSFFLLEQDDMVLVIFEFVDFPTLIRIQRVCNYWKKLIVYRSMPAILGNQAFLTRDELFRKIRQYCDNKAGFADELARKYGWPIGKWNVSQITNFSNAFSGTTFNEDINEWDMSNAINLSCMFQRAHLFNQDLFKWNTSKVTDMFGMFWNASSFNGDISTWNTSNVKAMDQMFRNAFAFNRDISNWDTSKVGYMSCMFFNARSFNQNISSWNVSNVFHNDLIFQAAESFDQENRPAFDI